METYWCPDETECGADVGNGQSRRLLLLTLPACATDPSQDDRVYTVGADREDAHGEVPGSNVQCRAGQNETKYRNCLGDGDMPRALVVVSRRGCISHRNDASNQEWWTGQNQCDCPVETKRAHNRRRKVLESCSPNMDMLHEYKDPDLRVDGSFLETSPHRDIGGMSNSVACHTVMSKLTLVFGEPPGRQWFVRQDETGDNSNDKGDDTLKNEKPAPAGDTTNTIKLEHADGDETGKGRGENVSRVQDADTGRNLLSSIEDGKKIESTGIVRGFHDTKEEAGEHDASVVLCYGSEATDDSPANHADTHVPGWSDAGDDHVARDLAKNVTDEENGNCSAVLGAHQAEIFLEIVQSSEGDGIAVEEVQPVHEPKHGLQLKLVSKFQGQVRNNLP